MSQGRSIRLFLVDGTPGGIITAEIINWTGHVISAPRSRLADILKRPEAAKPGVYMLIGDDPQFPERRMAYIGESENVGIRLTDHSKPESENGKDFWDKMLVFTSKDDNLTKGHLRYVESRLISIARKADRLTLNNIKGTKTEYGVLPEADTTDMQYLIEQLQILLPALGLELLRAIPSVAVSTSTASTKALSTTPVFILQNKHGVHAIAQEVDGEFIVRKGAFARVQPANSKWYHYKSLYERLNRSNILQSVSNDLLQLTEDYAFPSPSAAASFLLARSANGRIEWQVEGSDQTYAKWQETQIATVYNEQTK